MVFRTEAGGQGRGIHAVLGQASERGTEHGVAAGLVARKLLAVEHEH